MVITPTLRDSLYTKLQRGKHAVLQVKILDSALVKCDSSKDLLRKSLELSERQIDSLIKKNLKQLEVEKNLTKNIEDEIKRGRRRGFWNLVKGTGIGVAVMGILSAVSN